MVVECRLLQRLMQCNCADEHLPQVRTRMRQGWGAGEGTPTSLALRWEAWLHQVAFCFLLFCGVLHCFPVPATWRLGFCRCIRLASGL